MWQLLNAEDLCHSDQLLFSTGRWIFVNETNVKSFRCCGRDYNDYKDSNLVEYCTNETHLTGGRGCFCDELKNTRHTVSTREKYYWKPDNCTLMAFNASDFCRLLGNRKITLIGDSTMDQTASTLRSMIQNAQPKGLCGMQVTYGSSDYLVSQEKCPSKNKPPERGHYFQRCT